MAKIMLVEDDNNLREIYGARLMAEGYEIVAAKDGEEALALAVKEKPELIISDIMMPKISGFDMLDILRTTPETKNTKVIMMTALSQAEDKQRADKLGADLYLVKSQVTLEDVAKAVKDMLESPQDSTTSEPIAPFPAASENPVVTQAGSSAPTEPIKPAVEPAAAAEPVAATEPATVANPDPTPVSNDDDAARTAAASVAAAAAAAGTDEPDIDEAPATPPAPVTPPEPVSSAPPEPLPPANEAAHQAEAVAASAENEQKDVQAQVEEVLAQSPAAAPPEVKEAPPVVPLQPTGIADKLEPLQTQTPGVSDTPGNVIAPSPEPAATANTTEPPEAKPAEESPASPLPSAPAIPSVEPQEPGESSLPAQGVAPSPAPDARPASASAPTTSNDTTPPKISEPNSPFKSDVDPNQIAL